MADLDIDAVLGKLCEELAAIEHERWSHWQRYLHGKAVQNEDGSLTIASDLVDKWRRQMSAPYADLSEGEKQSDRDQVERYLPIISEALKVALRSKS